MQLSFTENRTGEWNDFLIKNNGHFLESFEWGEFQKALGKKVWRLVVKEGSETLAVCLIIKQALPLGKSFFYIPFGPVFKAGLSNGQISDIVCQILEKMKEIAKPEKAIFLHLEPYLQCLGVGHLNIQIGRIVKSIKDIQPKRTIVLDLDKSEPELLQGFLQKARYNIHLAERKGVKVRAQDEYHPQFYQLLKQTADKNVFRLFKEEHYRKLFDVASENFKVKMFLAEYQNKIIGAYILVIFGKMAVCLHGASDKNYRQLKAVNLLQWERIRYAKRAGCEQIDFWGIDEKKWSGITYFKKTFGGKEITHPQRYDIVFQKGWYKIYKVASRIKK